MEFISVAGQMSDEDSDLMVNELERLEAEAFDDSKKRIEWYARVVGAKRNDIEVLKARSAMMIAKAEANLAAFESNIGGLVMKDVASVLAEKKAKVKYVDTLWGRVGTRKKALTISVANKQKARLYIVEELGDPTTIFTEELVPVEKMDKKKFDELVTNMVAGGNTAYVEFAKVEPEKEALYVKVE